MSSDAYSTSTYRSSPLQRTVSSFGHQASRTRPEEESLTSRDQSFLEPGGLGISLASFGRFRSATTTRTNRPAQSRAMAPSNSKTEKYPIYSPSLRHDSFQPVWRDAAVRRNRIKLAAMVSLVLATTVAAYYTLNFAGRQSSSSNILARAMPRRVVSAAVPSVSRLSL